MKIRANVLCPIHIGSGEEISPSEYYIDREKGRFNRLNLNSLFQDEKFRPYRDKFIHEAARSRSISQIIADQSLLKKHILYSIPVSPEARQPLITNPCNIKTFIKSAGRVYLPGSSLKGAFFSAFLWNILKTKYKTDSRTIDQLITSNRYDDLLNEAFRLAFQRGALPTKAKFTHWLDVSDSNSYSPDQCLQISLARVKGAKRGGQIPIFYETVKEGVSFEMEIMAAEIMKANNFSEQTLLQIVHEFYSQVAQKDNAAVHLDPYLVRLGQGSSAFSTSLLLLADDLNLKYYNVNPPRTRKRLNEDIPMGFAQIQVQ